MLYPTRFFFTLKKVLLTSEKMRVAQRLQRGTSGLGNHRKLDPLRAVVSHFRTPGDNSSTARQNQDTRYDQLILFIFYFFALRLRFLSTTVLRVGSNLLPWEEYQLTGLDFVVGDLRSKVIFLRIRKISFEGCSMHRILLLSFLCLLFHYSQCYEWKTFFFKQQVTFFKILYYNRDKLTCHLVCN